MSDCLDACGRSNVVVLRRSGAEGQWTLWLGGVLGAEHLEVLRDWLAVGRAKVTVPESLGRLAFEPGESARGCLEAIGADVETARDAKATK